MGEAAGALTDQEGSKARAMVVGPERLASVRSPLED